VNPRNDWRIIIETGKSKKKQSDIQIGNQLLGSPSGEVLYGKGPWEASIVTVHCTDTQILILVRLSESGVAGERKSAKEGIRPFWIYAKFDTSDCQIININLLFDRRSVRLDRRALTAEAASVWFGFSLLFIIIIYPFFLFLFPFSYYFTIISLLFLICFSPDCKGVREA